jgi:hypothetical protein
VDCLDGYRVVVAPEDAWLTDRQRQKLDDFSRHGGLVVRSSTLRKPGDFVASLKDRLRLVVEAPPSVAVELGQQDNPRRVLIHLVNYDAERAVRKIPVTIRVRNGVARAVRVLSPGVTGEHSLGFRVQDGTCRFVLPELHVYALCAIDDASTE